MISCNFAQLTVNSKLDLFYLHMKTIITAALLGASSAFATVATGFAADGASIDKA